MRVDGACHCGAVRFAAEADAGQVSVCHCTDCQSLTGTAFRTSVRAVDGVSLAHSTNDTSSSFVTFRLSSNVRQVRLSVRISFSISFPFLKVRGSTGVFDKAA